MKLFLFALILAIGLSACASKVLVRHSTCERTVGDIYKCEEVN